MKKNIVLCHPLPDDLLARLQSVFSVAYFPDGITERTAAPFEAALAEAEGLVVSAIPRIPVTRELLAKAPKPRSVATVSVGYDHCDVPALTERGITLTNTPAVLTETTADTVFALILAAARRVVELGSMVREGRWTANITPEHYGINVHHKTIGIIGFGRIGQAVARRALGFGMRVVYTGPSRKTEAEQQYNAEYMPLDELLAAADFVCLTLQPSEKTRNLISREKIALMRPSAVLINISRGFVVDEDALAEALRDKKIHAAGLDVFVTEPLPATSPLRQLDNVVLLPHIGSATGETRYAMMACAVDNIIAALNGTLKENCVNRELLDA
ncbi:2-oxo-carboxylic acid reductase (glyoxalate reductase) (2-ketoaldonate reductase) [uncultured delta proteobacterium]|uniref:2-oxo-carboxylic acid reductase (Glyoxalate reductase) (2-ketoaldonate reductase) n=1 Tax=uncultured delta proteobacterium TaxID=34034 RepID=A0A212KAE2_9DELT|nr:2-oxo-carboxylic acid reductase (glyoxalate reductase) (2-ketoaldonate reductase) [uncultured delta proteobacterium]